jgi:hypothetical protein
VEAWIYDTEGGTQPARRHSPGLRQLTPTRLLRQATEGLATARRTT